MRRLVALLIALLGALLLPAAILPPLDAQAARHAVLITLDGLRTEEIFGGLDRAVLASTNPDGPIEDLPVYKQYWAATPEERRAKVMPFFWGTLMRDHGSIAGNRAHDTVRKWGIKVECALSSVVDRQRGDFIGRRPLWIKRLLD